MYYFWRENVMGHGKRAPQFSEEKMEISFIIQVKKDNKFK